MQGRARSRKRWRSTVSGYWLVLVGVVTTQPAWGQLCAANGEPWVSVDFAPGDWRAGLQQTALADLKAGLLNRGVVACRRNEGPKRDAIATVLVTSRDADSISVTVDVRDAITDKRVARDVDLRGIPPDGRALAVALAADELVWATWAEIAFEGSQRRWRAPSPVVAQVDRQVVRSRSNAVRFGLGITFEHFHAGLSLIGPELSVQRELTARLRLRVSAGLREGFNVDAPHGRVATLAATLGLDLQTNLYACRWFDWAWDLGTQGLWVRFKGKASGTVQTDEISGLTILARTGMTAGWALGSSIWLGISTGIGIPMRAIEATDGGRAITGTTGLEEHANVTFAGVF